MSDVSNGLKISTAHQPCILTLRPSSSLYLLNLMAANHQDDHDRHGNCQTGVSGQRPCSIYGISARPPEQDRRRWLRGRADIRRTNSAPLSAARSRDGRRMPRPPASKQNSRDNGNGDLIMQPYASAGIIGLGFMGTASSGGLIEARVALIEGMRRQPVASEVIR